MPDQVHIYDDMNQYSWEYLSIYYDYFDGAYQMRERYRLNDDQTTIDEYFQNGVLIEMVQTDSEMTYQTGEPAGIHDWDSIRTVFTYDGQLDNREFLFDDGRRVVEYYYNGTLEQLFQEDTTDMYGPNSAYDWQIMVIDYDENGQISDKFVQYDDGREVQEYYYNGVRNSVEERDYGIHSPDQIYGSQDWDVKYTAFDEQGALQFREIFYDDGTRFEENYYNGVRESTIKRDDGFGENGFGNHNWHEIRTYYDLETGDVIHRTQMNDDGTERIDEYDNGVLFRTQYQDHYNSEDAPAWHSVDIFYDQLGRMEYRHTENDDGTTKIDEWFEGVWTRSATLDNHHGPEGQAWHEQVFLFDDNGALEIKGYAWDDGDLDVTLYHQDGTKEHRSYDGDESDPWAGKHTFYDNTGAVTDSFEYADYGELPSDFIPDSIFGQYYV